MIKATVTIGIPAYNEEKNILLILKDLKNQVRNNFSIEKIIIANDCSSDNTVAVIKSLQDKKIQIIGGKNRRGQAYRQNQIIKNTKTDILVLLNADIRITNQGFLNKLVEPIVSQNVDLASTFPSPHRASTGSLLTRILETSVLIQKNIFRKLKDGNSIYTCHGRARAMSSHFYKTLEFKESIGEDAYSYLVCISKSFKYRSILDASIKYYLPATLRDYVRQSARFNMNRVILSKHFPVDLVTSELHIPMYLTLTETFNMLIKKPVLTILYILINLLVRFSTRRDEDHNIWKISNSTKGIKV